MYSDILKSKIDKMFDEISEKVSDAIAVSTTKEIAADNISRIVASATTSRSKTMLSDMYSDLSKAVLDKISDVSIQNRFYEADLRKEIFDKYDFLSNLENFDYKEINRLKISLGVGAGALAVGGTGIGIYAALSHALISTLVIPIAIVFAVAVGAFCASYFVATEKINKSKFKAAILAYLEAVKKDYISWFDEIEVYFNKRVEEIMS